jgi:ArsR family transcriptional regulator
MNLIERWTMTRPEQLMKAAGDPLRLSILKLLGRRAACVCEIQAILGIPQATASRHLATLRSAGLVHGVRRGTRVTYALAQASTREMRAFRRFLGEICGSDASSPQGRERQEAKRRGAGGHAGHGDGT